MYKTFLTIITVMCVALILPALASAGPDQYVGDTSIYGGTPTVVEPNVLIIVDDSGSMSDSVPGGIYDPNTTYAVVNRCINSSGQSNRPCVTNDVYTSSYNFFYSDVTTVTTSCNHANPRNLLNTTGQYNGRRLKTDGTCRSNGTGNYLLGNYVNWKFGPGADKPKINIARDVVNQLITSTHGMRFGLMRFHYPGGTGSPAGAQGSEFLNVSVGTTSYTTTIKDMDSILAGTTTNREALVQAVNTLSPRGYTPLGEALFEAMRYFAGGQTAFNNTVGVGAGQQYTSPISYGCQKNYIIFVTDGMDTASDSAVLRSICNQGDCDGDGREPGDLGHSMDDVAKYLYYSDLISTQAGTQNVRVYTIGFGLSGADQDAIDLLARVSDASHGNGNNYLAGSESELSTAFTSIMTEIFSVDTSFVAPVVPVSPENRTYSGSRVYMGFFKPEGGKFWSGNLKKYGLDEHNNIKDMGNRLATYVTSTDASHDDRDGAIVPVGASNGSFRDSSQSYWSTTNDKGQVDEGGVGEVLWNRTTPRNIYTYLPGNPVDLTNSTNAFIATNITPTTLGFADGDDGSRDDLIAFINGLDAYDANGNDDTTEKRTWILGDILHSRPQIVSYRTYEVATDETNCSRNTTMIFVGANDGMLHAFKDCDGSEAWAFVPPDLLPILQYLSTAGNAHTYYVDFSPTVYVYNKTQDGTINTANGDKVFLLFGLRRGGGLDSSPTKGYYYALDVTDPLTPKFMWKISNSTAGFSEMGEAWSDVTLGKIKVGSGTLQKKIAAFIGGGYDNCNEDARYGLTSTYTGACVSSPTGDSGVTTSAGTSAPLGPKGRALFIVDVATFDSHDIPQATASSGSLIWSFTNSTTTGMTFAMPGRFKPVDKNYDGYIDTLYAGDAGGNMWRFNIKDTSTTNWTANKIFSANPGYTAASGSLNGSIDNTVGRKIFYEPSAFVLEDESVRLFFGTGDREHPLNTAFADRLYSLIDRGQTTASAIKEANMADVTEDELQGLTTTTTRVSQIMSQLTSSVNYGWYIRLNDNAGEKVLSPAIVFNQLAVYTTYSPNSSVSEDPCVTGNLGTARVYVVDYLTGAAVINYDITNDTTNSTNPWVTGDSGAAGYNLMKSDRLRTLGGGIPSGAVLVVSQTGQTSLMIGVGGSIAGLQTLGGGVTMPIYWRQKSEHF